MEENKSAKDYVTNFINAELNRGKTIFFETLPIKSCYYYDKLMEIEVYTICESYMDRLYEEGILNEDKVSPVIVKEYSFTKSMLLTYKEAIKSIWTSTAEIMDINEAKLKYKI